MRKVLLSFLACVLLLIINTKNSSAALVVIEKKGNILWKVLSAEDEQVLNIPKYDLEVRSAADLVTPGDTSVSLERSNNKISLVVSSNGTTKELDVTDWKQDLIVVEERPEAKKVIVAIADDKFNLRQQSITATTDLSVTVDPKNAELSVKTDSGDKFLSVLPYYATQSLLRTKLINKITDNKIEILEEDGDLAYKISGEKIFNFFDVFSYSIPVTSYISASTGEVLRIDSPTIFKYLTFLFS